MCGIVGIVAPDSQQYSTAVQKMVDSLSHRGPDASGVHIFGNCALGHTRLSIVDLSTGQQPMLSATSAVAITFNGEIYGYKSLRASLQDYPFRTTSDTEVILASYERYHSDLLPHLKGMFAFGIWNEVTQELMCARDRFGEKPLYYTFGLHGEFLFASEIKALLASGLIRPVLNPEAIAHYLKHLYVHPYQTIYQNVSILPPGHRLLYSVCGGLTVERYWYLPEVEPHIKLTDAVEQFKYLFDRAVAHQLVADVPVGAFLSGGLDSSSVVAVASRHQSKLRTFSFDFEGSASELPFAREVAKRYRTDHMELADGKVDIGDLLLTMQEVYDEPFADSSNIPTYLISRLARKYVKVVLTGDGGDELLGGYSYWYQPLLHMNTQKGKYLWFVHLLRLATRLYTVTGFARPLSWQYKIQGFHYSRRYRSVAEAHLSQIQWFTNDDILRFGLSAPTKSLHPSKLNLSPTLDDVFRMDISNYLPGDILVKIDQASMAHGLELRAPFLDVDFASFCLTLPYALKVTTQEDKLILRRAYATLWPPSLQKRSKQGFVGSIQGWLKRDSIKILREEYLNNPSQKIFSLLSFKHTRPVVNQDNYQTWLLLVLALWLDRHEFDLK